MFKKIIILNVLVSFLVVTLGKRGSHSTVKLPTLLSGRLLPRFDYAKQCENDVKSVSMIYKTTSIVDRGINYGYGINGILTLTRPFSTIQKVILNFDTCNSGTHSSCEHFYTWRIYNESCSVWTQKNALWSPVYNFFDPHLNCPGLVGVYMIRNATINMETTERLPFPLEKYLCKISYGLYDADMIACFEIGLHYMRTRS